MTPRAASRTANGWRVGAIVMFSDSQALNLLAWGLLVLIFALGYIGGRLR